jgi:hypothetical protein
VRRLDKTGFSGRFWALLPAVTVLSAALGALIGFSMYVTLDWGAPMGNAILGALPSAIIGVGGLLAFELVLSASEAKATGRTREGMDFQDRFETPSEDTCYRQAP